MKKAFIGSSILLGIVVLIGTILPSSFLVTEQITIDAPAAKVHAIVNDLKTWNSWGSWYESNPSMKQSYGELTSGVGASQSWTDKSGSGKLLFTKVEPEIIEFDLFFDEFPKSTAKFEFEAQESSTTVTWTMEGDMPMAILGGYMVLILEPAIKEDFKKGLGKLKKLAESNASQG
jgi:uncharacterized membrane protein